MADMVKLRLIPLGVEFRVPRGSPLEDLLFPYGVEFPCGGAGRCRGCRIRVLEGEVPITAEMERAFTPRELAEGWRLACRSSAGTPLTIEVAQWETPVLTDETPLDFTPSEGFAIAIDLGTTTLAVQLVDCRSGAILGVRTGINPQSIHGADIMSRIEHALTAGDGESELRRLIRESLGRMCEDLGTGRKIRLVLISGNTVMHHLFCGISVDPLGRVPFESPDLGAQQFTSAELGWKLPGDPEVRFLPCPGGFVGSDILAGAVACGIHTRDSLTALIDLGTNGEIVVGNREGIVCASTAAGPAFEGGRIRMGMRAAEGAIAHVDLGGESGAPRIECHVLGGGKPRGICGSGLVDAVACALESNQVLPNGRIASAARELPLAAPVRLWQSDIRELQLAKGAIAAGLRILAGRCGASPAELETVHVAGAFGNYIRLESACRIGLLETGIGRLQAAGNTSLRGTRMVLLRGDGGCEELRRVSELMQHVPLIEDPDFQDLFLTCMGFPNGPNE